MTYHFPKKILGSRISLTYKRLKSGPCTLKILVLAQLLQILAALQRLKESTYTNSRSVLGLCRQRYICLKLSMTNSGRSLTVLPMWWSGCENLKPSAVSAFTTSDHEAHISYEWGRLN